MASISFIGMGNVSFHLCHAFRAAGHTIQQIVGRDMERTRSFAEAFNAAPIVELALLEPADFVFCCVGDDTIAEVVRQLKPTEALVVHTAGSVSMDVLAGKVAHYGVCYPAQTFSKAVALDVSNVPFCIEANSAQQLQKLEALAKSVSQQVFGLSSAQRKHLHLAAVIACNFSNYLYSVAHKLLQAQNINPAVLDALVLETAKKSRGIDPSLVQTGPAIRGNKTTMQKHLELLGDEEKLKQLYRLISEGITGKS